MARSFHTSSNESFASIFLNALTQKDIEELWLPEVIYDNTDTTRLGVTWEWSTMFQFAGKET